MHCYKYHHCYKFNLTVTQFWASTVFPCEAFNQHRNLSLINSVHILYIEEYGYFIVFLCQYLIEKIYSNCFLILASAKSNHGTVRRYVSNSANIFSYFLQGKPEEKKEDQQKEEKEEKKEEKEEDPWWTPKLSRGNKLHVVLCNAYRENNWNIVISFLNLLRLSVIISISPKQVLVIILTGFRTRRDWRKQRTGLLQLNWYDSNLKLSK